MAVTANSRQARPSMGRKLECEGSEEPCNVEITDGQQTRVVHVNQLRHRVQPTANTAPSVAYTRHGSQQGWNPPQVEHVLLPSPSFSPQPTQSTQRYPQRERDGHPIASHKLEVELYLEDTCVERLQSRTSMVHNIKIMICCIAIGHAWIIL